MPDKTWLNLLPLEVSTRIAAFISGRARNIDLLHFAQLGKAQSEAAFASLSNTLAIFPDLRDNILWASLCPPTTKKLLFNSNDVDDMIIPSLLSKTRIQRADMSLGADDNMLRCVRACKGLRELAVFFCNENDRSVLWDTLRTLKVEKLELICGCNPDEDGFVDVSECLYCDEEYFNADVNVLASCCPELRQLVVSDCCLISLPDDESAMPLVRGLDKLERLIIRGSVDPYLRGQLPENTFFELDEIEDIDEALSFGCSLLKLEMHDWFSRAQVSALKACVNLETLSIVLEAGGEEELVTIVPMLHSLKSLKLRWGEYSTQNAAYASVRPGVLLQLVQAAPKITMMGFEMVKVCAQELARMLEFVGPKLETLDFSVQQQAEGALKRWEQVILAVAKYNPNIQFFAAMDAGFKLRKHARIQKAMEFLRKRCPHRTWMVDAFMDL